MSQDEADSSATERLPASAKRQFTEKEKYGFDPETAFRPFLIFVAMLLSVICVCLLLVLCCVLPTIN